MAEKKKRTFKNLIGYTFTEACFNSDGEVVEGTEEEVVLLYNPDRISEEEVDKLLQNGMAQFSNKVLIIPKAQALNLTDLFDEEKK